MLYFIPAWYQKNTWNENEQNWYVRREHTEFDDTVKQIQLFHRSRVYPYRLLLPSFAPNLRHFLHRQSVYHAPYWSCFDAIQEIKKDKIRMLSFRDLNWPEHIEFVYTPFVLLALLQGQKYAQVEFGEDGNPIQIDMFEHDVIRRRNIYDDRGFVSSTIVYEAGQPVYRDYLTEKGMWKLRLFYRDGRVEINPRTPIYRLKIDDREESRHFSRNSYHSLEEVIAEVMTAYVELTEEDDIFCVAAQEQNLELLAPILRERKTILSLFENRLSPEQCHGYVSLIGRADYVITDSRENTALVRETAGRQQRIRDITPYDSRVDFGISQQLNVQKILVPVDGLAADTFAELIRRLGGYLPENANARIVLFTRQAAYDRKQQLLSETRRILDEAGMEPGWAVDNPQENPQGTSENTLDMDDAVPVRFLVEQCVDELSVSRCMREQRLVIDLRQTAEVYLRIAALSVGIPQLIRTESQFVEPGRNGMLVKNMDELPELLDYYLDGLANWNEAMVQSYELGKKFSTDVLIGKWKEVIEVVRRNQSITAGEA